MSGAERAEATPTGGSPTAMASGEASYDVIVIGAGPAGSAAAIELARGGARVLVVDKATFPRDKCCGDGLTTGALRRLEHLGLDPAAVPSWTWVDDVVLSTPRTHVVRFPLPRDSARFAAVAMRVELDDALVQLARAAGAEVREATSLRTISQTSEHVRCELDGPSGPAVVAARHVVAADGMWSTTRKLLVPAAGPGERPYLGEWHGYRQYARNVHTEASRDLWIWFEPDLVPGYLWSFPLAHGRVNLGFGIERTDDRATKEMKALWPDLLSRPQVRAVLGEHVELEGTPKAWPIPADVTDAVASVGRVLFVGDAVRACDVLTGEGIGQALQTGMLAATAVLANADGRADDAGSAYGDALLDELGPDHRMASALQAMMSKRPIAEAAIRISGASGWTRRNFARWLFEDYPRGIALTPRRWRWGLMSGDGAYADR